jgi:hypothetical protein
MITRNSSSDWSPEVAARLDALINRRSIVGDRYNAATQAEIDTENFA